MKKEQNEDDILPVLRVSYEQLPSGFKRCCFVCCSSFPKNCEYNDYELIQFWMVHGLLQSSDGESELEEIGSIHLKDLEYGCFLQDFRDLYLALPDPDSVIRQYFPSLSQDLDHVLTVFIHSDKDVLDLHISGCGALNFPNLEALLQELRIFGCPRLDPETGDDWEKISHTPKVIVDNVDVIEQT
ncbi:hypothetical protein SADUNF_Sadunf12G0020300 [Salix dunnii]|uniref:Disease resistance protein winged helix domain-containing protein n=1 Tax=Salix dunnii TaxID=1413687 RepID=A0A835JH79_9ROSI|nr:hypothetical protein SADUNF_Sadunf12G0020300 [Salix dunnii]